MGSTEHIRRRLRPKGPLRRGYDAIFPREQALPEALQALLAQVYPTLDQSRISWHRGLPWFLLGTYGPNPMGITLPSAFGRKRCQIFLRDWLPGNPKWESMIVHEAFHALQMQEASEGLHWGTLHPFLVAYLSSATTHRYFDHPMEAPAFAIERSLAEAQEQGELLICERADFAFPDASWRLVPVGLAVGLLGLLRPTAEALLHLPFLCASLWPSRR